MKKDPSHEAEPHQHYGIWKGKKLLNIGSHTP